MVYLQISSGCKYKNGKIWYQPGGRFYTLYTYPNWYQSILITFPVSASALARIEPLYLESGQFLDAENKQVAVLGQVATGEQLDRVPALMDKAKVVVMNAVDWQVICYIIL